MRPPVSPHRQHRRAARRNWINGQTSQPRPVFPPRRYPLRSQRFGAPFCSLFTEVEARVRRQNHVAEAQEGARS